MVDLPHYGFNQSVSLPVLFSYVYTPVFSVLEKKHLYSFLLQIVAFLFCKYKPRHRYLAKVP